MLCSCHLDQRPLLIRWKTLLTRENTLYRRDKNSIYNTTLEIVCMGKKEIKSWSLYANKGQSKIEIYSITIHRSSSYVDCMMYLPSVSTQIKSGFLFQKSISTEIHRSIQQACLRARAVKAIKCTLGASKQISLITCADLKR